LSEFTNSLDNGVSEKHRNVFVSHCGRIFGGLNYIEFFANLSPRTKMNRSRYPEGSGRCPIGFVVRTSVSRADQSLNNRGTEIILSKRWISDPSRESANWSSLIRFALEFPELSLWYHSGSDTWILISWFRADSVCVRQEICPANFAPIESILISVGHP
jgi:hypothetical protein